MRNPVVIIKRVFEVARHEEYGELGLRMVGMPWADPLTGVAVAHDMLEHFPKDGGAIESELMALGASLYVRDCGAYFAQKGLKHSEAYKNLAADFPTLFSWCLENGPMEFPDPGKTRPLDDEECEQQAREAVEEAARLMVSEFDADYTDAREFMDVRQQARAFGWFRKGYRKACKRYRGIPAWKVCQAFNNIEQEADQFLKNARHEGQRASIACNVATEEVTLLELDREDY